VTECDGISALRQPAHRIDSDANLAQGAGGNVSAKVGETLRIKASGTRLATMRRETLSPSAGN
jgi:rhamnose utilization protein RhaD (predicted bifunctional aldolase and dehydrogenase)